MPTPAEIAAAVSALHALREKYRIGGGNKWPTIEEEALVALEAAARASWQLIETAPRDFSQVLCFIPGNFEQPAEYCIAFWKRDGWRLQGDDHIIIEPTHWMLLQPPTDDKPVAGQQKNTDAAGG